MKDNPLTIEREDSAVKTELEFISNKQYTLYNQNVDLPVLFSHISNERYNVPVLSMEDLECFEKTGSTLRIDYTKTYIRYFALDIDCLCKNGSLSHTTNDDIKKIIDIMVNIINATLKIDRKIEYSVWKNNCGYHIYTNVLMSLPTHEYLIKLIQSTASQIKLVIDFPELMPLPYSSKDGKNIYNYIEIGTYCTKIVPFIGNGTYYELFAICNENHKNTRLILHSKFETFYFVHTQVTKKINCIQVPPNIISIDNVSIANSFELPLTTLYFMNKQIKIVEGCELLPVNNIMCAAIEFIKHYNFIVHNENENTDFSHFILDCSSYEYWYFLHYIVALVKYVYTYIDEKIKETEIRKMLKEIFKNSMSNDVVNITVSNFNIDILTAYPYSSIEMVVYLCNINRYKVGCMDHQSMFNKIMELRLNILPADFKNLFNKKLNDKSEELLNKFVLAVVDIFKSMKFVATITSQNLWYYYIDGIYRRDTSIDKYVVGLISDWITPNHINSIKSNIIGKSIQFRINEICFDRCKTLIATYFGTFSLYMGIYFYPTPLTHFMKIRRFAIWPNVKDREWYPALNYDLIKSKALTEKFVDVVHNRMNEVFGYFVFIPSIIQLRWVYSVTEEEMNKTMLLLADHSKKLDFLLFLLEYYPIDHKFIYLILIWLREYNYKIVLNYTTLKFHIFGKTKVTNEEWELKYRSELDEVKFEIFESYLDELKSLNGPNFSMPTNVACFYAVFIAIYMLKCNEYQQLTSVFNVCIPLPRKIHELFPNEEQKTNADNLKFNLNRASSILFGKKLSKLEQYMSDAVFATGIAKKFMQDGSSSLIDCFSITFSPFNENKKLILFVGQKDTGKSGISDIITAMGEPHVARLMGDIKSVTDRGGLPTKVNFTILNDASSIDSEYLKALTGNDGKSTQIFYSQEYEMQYAQSILFGATNVYVDMYLDSKKNIVGTDKTTVQRLYPVCMYGKYRSENFSTNSLLSLMSENDYYRSLFDTNVTERAYAFSMIGYHSFISRMDSNGKLMLNNNLPDIDDYLEVVYRNNNTMYAFLHKCGISEHDIFFMDKGRFEYIIKKEIEKKHSKFKNFDQFVAAFHAYNGIDLHKDNLKIHNFQETSFIENVSEIMDVSKNNNFSISREDLNSRLSFYKDYTLRGNAEKIFIYNNSKYYNPEIDKFVGIKFSNELPDDENGLDEEAVVNPAYSQTLMSVL